MNRDGRSCVSKIHVVVCLVAELRIKFLLVGQLILAVDIVDHDALLVDGEPVLDLVLVLVEDEAGIILKVIHDLAAAPAAVLVHQCHRQVVVPHGDHRLDVMGVQLVQKVVVEFHAFRVGFAHTIGQDACPVDGEAIGAEPHFCHQGNVLFVVMVMVAGNAGIRIAVFIVNLTVDHVLLVILFAITLSGTLALVGAGCGSPQEPFRETSYDFH